MKNEGKTTSIVERATRKVPSLAFLELAFGAMALSAALALSGRMKLANFVGQWVPTILILGTYNKVAKTFTAPFSEEQRARHGDHTAYQKSQAETSSAQTRPLPVT